MIHGWNPLSIHSLKIRMGSACEQCKQLCTSAKRKFQVRKFTFKMTPIGLTAAASSFRHIAAKWVTHLSLSRSKLKRLLPAVNHIWPYFKAHPNKKAISITRTAQNNAPFRFWLAWELAVGEKLMWELWRVSRANNSVTARRGDAFRCWPTLVHGAIEFASPDHKNQPECSCLWASTFHTHSNKSDESWCNITTHVTFNTLSQGQSLWALRNLRNDVCHLISESKCLYRYATLVEIRK